MSAHRPRALDNARPTQTDHPWRASARTIFQAVVAFAAMWGVVVEAIGLDPAWEWVAASLVVAGAITRVMALPSVEEFLRRFLPFLAAAPAPPVEVPDEDPNVAAVVRWGNEHPFAGSDPAQVAVELQARRDAASAYDEQVGP